MKNVVFGKLIKKEIFKLQKQWLAFLYLLTPAEIQRKLNIRSYQLKKNSLV